MHLPSSGSCGPSVRDTRPVCLWSSRLSRNHIVTLQSIGSNSAADRLYRDAASPSAPIDFLAPTDLSNRVWWAAKAIDHLILTSGKTGLRRRRCQTLSLERHPDVPPRDGLRWPIRCQQTSPKRLSGASIINRPL